MKKKNITTSQVNESPVEYGKREFHIFRSFEEQEEYELQKMAKLTPIQILQQLRQFINIAYGMHGYNPEKLPAKHTIKILDNNDKQ